LLEYKERDKVLKDTITTATQMAERMRTDADREARLIIADAQQKAEIITRDSRDSLEEVYTKR
jgi:cell division initiation protein